jgi:predicted nucleic-acid-binding protein
VIAVDSNVLLRLFVADDERQMAAVRSFFENRSADDPAFISSVVVTEFVWLLDRSYGFAYSAILAALDRLLASPDFVIEHAEVLADCISMGKSLKVDVADYLIVGIAREHGCEQTVSFERPSSRRIPGMVLLK